MSDRELEQLRHIISGGGTYNADALALQRSTSATAAFYGTWPRVRRNIEHACSEPLCESFAAVSDLTRQIDRDLDYLEGLGWYLFDRPQRKTIKQLRRAVRDVASSANSGQMDKLRIYQAICRDQLVVVSNNIEFPHMGISALILPVVDDLPAERDEPPVNAIRQSEMAVWRARVAAEAGAQAFAWYRVRCAVRRRRFRSSVRLFRDWLSLAFRGDA